ncbi:MAG: CHASE2 domain-containing protein, partial [Elusimicrobiota bacterium]
MKGKLLKKFKELKEVLKKKGAKAKWTLAYITIPTSLLIGALFLRFADPAALVDIRHWTFDAFQRAAPREYRPDSPVRIIDIDDESLEKIGQWPWPRTQVAAVVERLQELGVGVIVFDVVFAEPDRTSPKQIAKSLPDAPGMEVLKSELKKLPDNDRVLAKAIKRATVVTGFSLTHKKNLIRPVLRARFGLGSVQKKKLVIKEGQSRIEAIQEAARKMKHGDEADLTTFLPEHYAGAIKNVAILELAAKGNGNFSILRDRDGIIRRVPLLYKLDGDIYPSLVAEALRVAQGTRDIKVKASGASGEIWRGFIGIASVRIGTFTIPTDQEGRVLLYDTGHQPERYVPVWKLFDESFDASALAGSIAFIGTSAAGLQDIRATPLSPIIPGVEIHAQLAEQILSGEFLERPDYATAVEIWFLILLGAVLIGLMPRLGAAWCAVIAVGAVAGAFGLSWYEYTAKRYLLDPLYPSLAVLLVYFSSSLINYLRTESERKQVRGAFSRYMSPALVEQLAKDPSRLRLGGEKRDMTLMFS